MPIENGINWQPIDPHLRGRRPNFASSLQAVMADFMRERDPFYNSVVDQWLKLFPDIPARPGRLDGKTIYLFVTKATTSYVVARKLPMIRRTLAALPNAPKGLQVRVEIHSANMMNIRPC